MDNRERFLSAIKLKEADRVPFFDYFDKAPILNIAKALFEEDLSEINGLKSENDQILDDDVYKYQELHFKIIRKMDIDAIVSWSLKDFQKVPGREDLVKDGYGIIWRLTKHGEPMVVEGPVKNSSDLKKISVIQPNRSGFSLLEHFKKQVPERVLVYALIDPFRLSWSLLGGLEELLLQYVMDPDFCLRLARIATDFVKQEFQLAVEKGAEVIVLEGDLAFKMNTFMSKDHYRQFVKPYHHEICEIARKQGIPIIKHSDGNVWLILDDLIEAGFDGVHPVEPQCMEITEVKNHLAGKACILGNIDCMHLLPFGTTEEVIRSVKHTIQKVAPGGGYILCFSNSIHPGCKSENVIAMFEAAKKYGAYPIEVNQGSFRC